MLSAKTALLGKKSGTGLQPWKKLVFREGEAAHGQSPGTF